MVCDHCQLSRDFCSRWAKREGGGWTAFTPAGRRSIGPMVIDEVEEYCMVEDVDVSYGMEADVVWLSKPLVIAGVEASEMVRQLSDWTRGLDAYRYWRTGKAKDGGTLV